MRKNVIAFLSVCLLLPPWAMACQTHSNAENSPSGIPPPPRSYTVKEAKRLRDDTKVVLQGHLIRYLGNEKYEFRDGSGSIVVEIEHEDWRGISFAPPMLLKIWGEVDKEMGRVEVDVDFIEYTPPP